MMLVSLTDASTEDGMLVHIYDVNSCAVCGQSLELKRRMEDKLSPRRAMDVVRCLGCARVLWYRSLDSLTPMKPLVVDSTIAYVERRTPTQ